MSGRRGGGGPGKGKDVVHQLSVTLENLYSGTVRKLALQKKVICVNCEGTNEKDSRRVKFSNVRGRELRGNVRCQVGYTVCSIIYCRARRERKRRDGRIGKEGKVEG